MRASARLEKLVRDELGVWLRRQLKPANYSIFSKVYTQKCINESNIWMRKNVHKPLKMLVKLLLAVAGACDASKKCHCQNRNVANNPKRTTLEIFHVREG
jgi:hypothetical protein